jgi:hypothetical protein
MDEARWADVVDRYMEQAGMYWLPPKGLDNLKSIACNRGLWEDLGNGYVTKKPKKKTTSAQVITESEPDDHGKVRLRVIPVNAGPAPKIYYAEDSAVSETSPVLSDQYLTTSALRVAFLVKDPSNQYDTGEPVIWTNKLVLRNRLVEIGDQRTVELMVAPRGEIRYTLDGSEPREGTVYTRPIPIDDKEARIQVFAHADGLEAKREFTFPARSDKGVKIDRTRPGKIIRGAGFKLDSRANTFEGLKLAREKEVEFQGVNISIGQGTQMVSIVIGEIPVTADFIESLLNKALEKFDPKDPITMTFRRASFSSGHDLKEFADKLGIELTVNEVEQ